MADLLSRTAVPLDKADFWIEDSCIVPLRTLVFLHYEELLEHNPRPVADDYQDLMNNVRRWFDSDPAVIDNAEALKDRLYSREVLRGILGGRTCA